MVGISRIIAILLIGILALSMVSCNEEEETPDMMDVLKISTYLLDKDIEGTDYWAYSDDWKTYPKHGYWVSNDSGEILDNDDVFKNEQLVLNEPRIMAPLSYKGMNLNVLLDYYGIIEVEADTECDERLQLCYCLVRSNKMLSDTWVYENKFRAHGPIYLNICPLARFTENNASKSVNRGSLGITLSDTLIDVEYNITIKAYEDDGTLVITAKLKLIALKDEFYPYQDVKHVHGLFGRNEERTRFLSIELVSYEYSDIYKIGNDAFSIEEETDNGELTLW